MVDIEKWSIGDDMLFEAIHMAELQGEIRAKLVLGSLEDWEADWYLDKINNTLIKFDIKPVNTIKEALLYNLTTMQLKLKGQELLEAFGREIGKELGC